MGASPPGFLPMDLAARTGMGNGPDTRFRHQRFAKGEALRTR